MVRIATAGLAALLAIGTAQAQEAAYKSEAAARSCVHKRLGELIAQNQRRNIADDAALAACTSQLKAELKEHRKNDCEATDYVGWVVASENSRVNGLSGQPYKRNDAFIKSCERPSRGKQR